MQGAQHHFARVDAGLRERAAKQLFERDQPVLAVQEQHGKHLVVARTQLQLQVFAHRLRAVEQGFLLQLLRQRAAREFEYCHHLGAFGRPQALDDLERLGPGVQQATDTAEGVQQLLRELHHVFSGDAGAQQQRQQLGVAER
ncbi:hypothetical protein FQZ97_891600 [compost metagenome]